MKYINVFETESAFNDVSNNLEKPLLAYINDGKIFSLSESAGPGPVVPANNEILIQTVNNVKFDMANMLEVFLQQLQLPDTSINKCISNTYNENNKMWSLKFQNPVNAIGMDGNIQASTVNMLYPLFMRLTDEWPAIISIIYPNNVLNVFMMSILAQSLRELLTSITFNSVNVPEMSDDAFINLSTACTIYVPAESVDAYKIANGWSAYAKQILAI